MRHDLTPLEVCERLIGPPSAIAAAVGYTEKAPYLWRKESDVRDAGDLPSVRIMRKLLTHAAARGIPLTAEHLIWGADAAEIEALLSPAREAAE